MPEIELTTSALSEQLDLEDASLLGTQLADPAVSERSCVATHFPPAAAGVCLGLLLFFAAITLWTPRGGLTSSELLLSRIRDIERRLDVDGTTEPAPRSSKFAAPTQAALSAAQCSSESCADSSLAWSSPLTGTCYAAQAKSYYINCNGKKAEMQPS